MNYNQAPIQLAFIDEHGERIYTDEPIPMRWVTIQDAEHDFIRIQQGLPAERDIKPERVFGGVS